MLTDIQQVKKEFYAKMELTKGVKKQKHTVHTRPKKKKKPPLNFISQPRKEKRGEKFRQTGKNKNIPNHHHILLLLLLSFIKP